jgi:hypothetical protein
VKATLLQEAGRQSLPDVRAAGLAKGQVVRLVKRAKLRDRNTSDRWERTAVGVKEGRAKKHGEGKTIGEETW